MVVVKYQVTFGGGGGSFYFVGCIRFFATVGDLRVLRYTTLQQPKLDGSACLLVRYTNWLHRTFYAGCQRECVTTQHSLRRSDRDGSQCLPTLHKILCAGSQVWLVLAHGTQDSLTGSRRERMLADATQDSLLASRGLRAAAGDGSRCLPMLHKTFC